MEIKSNVGFWRRGEPEYEKTSQCRVENQQTQNTYDAHSGDRTQATLVGGFHHCTILAPHPESASNDNLCKNFGG